MNVVKKIFWYPFNSKERIEELQEEIRLKEWNSFESYILTKGDFLDVGCGAGHNLELAATKKNCVVSGVDPEPGAHGVGRFTYEKLASQIQQGHGEQLPFEDKKFDTVFCSHVLEHVNSEAKTLKEIDRVLKEDGVAIIGMPTATMAWINLFSHYLFTTHRNVLFMFKAFGTKEFGRKFKHVFISPSHSYPRASTICYDLNHYRVSKWKKTISEQFEIEKIVQPLLYPYPDYIQWFQMKKSKLGSSSVFFVCKKKS